MLGSVEIELSRKMNIFQIVFIVGFAVVFVAFVGVYITLIRKDTPSKRNAVYAARCRSSLSGNTDVESSAALCSPFMINGEILDVKVS